MRTTSAALVVVGFALSATACGGSDEGGGATPPAGDAGTTGSDGGGGGGGGGPGQDGGVPESCTAATSPTTFLTDVDMQFGRPALDDQYVYVPGKFAGGTGVQRFPKAGGPGTPLASTPLSGTADLAVLAGDDVWFVASSTGTLYKVPKAGGAATYTEVANGYNTVSQRRLVADADAVYLLAWKGSDAVIDRFPVAGGAPQTIATLPSAQYVIALQGDDVWYSGGPIANVGVYRVPKTGGTPERISGELCLPGFAVDADSIYCAGLNAVRKIPRAGGAGTTIYDTPPNTIDRIDSVVFSDDASVAYVNDRMGEPNTKAARVSRVVTATGATTTLACGTMPMKRMGVGPDSLAWGGNFVGVIPKEDLQLVPR